MSNSRFRDQIKHIQKGLKDIPAKSCAYMANRLHNKIVISTPRDEGTAQANWNLSAGSPIKGFDPSKTEPEFKLLRTNQLIEKPVAYITNHTPWIMNLEFGTYPNPNKEHWSKKPLGIVTRKTAKGYYVIRTTTKGFSLSAPNGMVRVALQEAKTYL